MFLYSYENAWLYTGEMYLSNAYGIEIDTKNMFYDLFAYIIKIINVDGSHKSVTRLKFLIYFTE